MARAALAAESVGSNGELGLGDLAVLVGVDLVKATFQEAVAPGLGLADETVLVGIEAGKAGIEEMLAFAVAGFLHLLVEGIQLFLRQLTILVGVDGVEQHGQMRGIGFGFAAADLAVLVGIDPGEEIGAHALEVLLVHVVVTTMARHHHVAVVGRGGSKGGGGKNGGGQCGNEQMAFHV